ncbi:hypothetical protein G7046_g1044 [Stylonectria norvegica]|nr:hypothetical protein G7046_g1044 [Stylonectria norvegica]
MQFPTNETWQDDRLTKNDLEIYETHILTKYRKLSATDDYLKDNDRDIRTYPENSNQDDADGTSAIDEPRSNNTNFSPADQCRSRTRDRPGTWKGGASPKGDGEDTATETEEYSCMTMGKSLGMAPASPGGQLLGIDLLDQPAAPYEKDPGVPDREAHAPGVP